VTLWGAGGLGGGGLGRLVCRVQLHPSWGEGGRGVHHTLCGALGAVGLLVPYDCGAQAVEGWTTDSL